MMPGMLDRQFCLHPSMGAIASELFYQDRLRSAPLRPDLERLSQEITDFNTGTFHKHAPFPLIDSTRSLDHKDIHQSCSNDEHRFVALIILCRLQVARIVPLSDVLYLTPYVA